MTHELIGVGDYFLAIIYLTLILSLGFVIKQKHIEKNHQSYFITGLFLKLIASQLIVLVYVFYYKIGDTIGYFKLSKIYTDYLLESHERLSFFDKIGITGEELRNIAARKFLAAFGYHESSMIVIRLAGYLNLFTFQSFLITTMLFSVISFSGQWALFNTFTNLYPTLHKEMALSIIFFPSVVFWGSGLMKDTLCIAALGWFTWAFCNLLILRKKKSLFKIILYIISIYVSATILTKIKIYIIASYVAGVLIWLFLNYRDTISNKFLRVIITPFIIGVGTVIIILGLQSFSEELGVYALENIVDTAMNLANNLNKMEAGSTYTLGAIDGSLGSLLRNIPAAVNVTLFRPYLWEVRNVVMIISAFESTMVLMVTLIIVFKVGVWKSLSTMFSNGLIFFCMIFTLIFGFAVGFSSSNFGTLVRYKIPLLPFYMSSLFILYYTVKNESFIDTFLKKKKSKS